METHRPTNSEDDDAQEENVHQPTLIATHISDGDVLLETDTRHVAMEEANGCRPAYEFIQTGSILNGENKVYTFKCADANCNLRRYVTCSIPSTKSKQTTSKESLPDVPPYKVIQWGQHDEAHAAVHRARYPFSEEQRTFMEKRYNASDVTPKMLKRTLVRANLLRGCPQRTLSSWLFRRRKQDESHKQRESISDVSSFVAKMKKETRWKGKNEHRPLLLPLPDGSRHVQTGSDVTVIRGTQPRRTDAGEPFSFIIPMSTPRLLRRRAESRGEKYRVLNEDCFKTVLEKGFIVDEVDSEGFAMIDGVHSLIKGDGVILNLGTVSKRGKFHRIAIAIASGETGESVQLFLHAVDLAEAKLFKEPCPTKWLLSDCGGAMLKGTGDYADAVKEAGGDPVKCGVCYTHFAQDTIPKMTKYAKGKNFMKSVKRDVTRMAQFPPTLFKKVYSLVARTWKRKKETKFEKAFTKEHVEHPRKNGWSVGYFAFGLPSSTNVEELDHKNDLKKTLLETLRGAYNPEGGDVQQRVRLPAGLIQVITLFWAEILTIWSEEADDPEQELTLTNADHREAKNMAFDPNFIQVSENVFCSRQLTDGGALEIITQAQAKTVAGMYVKDTWRINQAKKVMTIRFSSPTFCFPCRFCALNDWCTHQNAARVVLNLPPLGKVSGTDLIPVGRKRRGATKRKNRPRFYGEKQRVWAARPRKKRPR
jgi:hypothetical protein